MKNVAIQRNLTPIKNYLSSKGYTVQEFDGNLENAVQNLNNVEAVVVTGQGQNALGMENTSTKIPIIDANGMTPEAVEKMITAKP